jgi:hypothetical protein
MGVLTALGRAVGEGLAKIIGGEGIGVKDGQGHADRAVLDEGIGEVRVEYVVETAEVGIPRIRHTRAARVERRL